MKHEINKKLGLMIIIATSLVACGKPPVLQIDPEFSTTVNTFKRALVQYQATDVNMDNLIIKFADVSSMLNSTKYPTIADCVKSNDDVPTISVDTTWWATALAADKESVLFHELGHCVLNRDHDNTITPNPWFPDSPQIAHSIMNATATKASASYNRFELQTDYSREIREMYVKELIENRKTQ